MLGTCRRAPRAAEEPERHVMGGKEKGGREVRKPKADKNKKATGQTPRPVDSALSAVAGKSRGKT